MYKILAVALAGLLLQTSLALSSEVYSLPPVVVTATRVAQPTTQIPASTTVITADEIVSSGARDLGEVLRDVVSVDVVSNGPRGTVSNAKIRGSSAQQVLVLLDGIRLNSEQLGIFDLSSLPVALKDIERIEIVRGPGSALYGSAASGGVIQIITKKAETTPATTANWSEGSYDTRNFGLSQSWQIGRYYYRVGAVADRSDGYRANSDLNQESYNGLLGIDLPGDFNVEAYGYHIDKKVGAPFKITSPTLESRQKDKNTFSQLKLAGPLGPIQITARAIYDRQRSEFVDPSTAAPEYAIDDTHKLETIGTETQLTWQSGIHTIIFGGDYYSDELKSSANGHHEQDRWSLFSQYEIEPSEWMKLLFGLRFDDHSDFRSVFSPRAGLVFYPKKQTAIRLSAGKSFRAPTLNDRFWPNQPFAYNDWVTGELITGGVEGNPDLDPETAWEYEIGLNQSFGEWGAIDVAGFMRQAKDLIDWATDEENWSRPTNVNKTRTWGAEAEISLQPTQYVKWVANYTFLRPKDRDTDDFLLNIPHHQAGSYLELGPIWDTNLRIAGRYARYYNDPARKYQSYIVFDATISRPVLITKNLELELMVAARNIFDREYEVDKGFPMPPAEIQVGITGFF